MEELSRLIVDRIHSATYSWSHTHGLSIKIVSALVLGLTALAFFRRGASHSRHRLADATFGIVGLVLFGMSVLDYFRWGSQSFWLFAWQWGSFGTCATAYYLPMRILSSQSKGLGALFAVLFVASGWIFIEMFFLSSILPVNVMINWA